jgi:hypothetical protein
MECNKITKEIIDFNKLDEYMNEYNIETNGDFNDYLTKCDTKGGGSRDTKLNK